MSTRRECDVVFLSGGAIILLSWDEFLATMFMRYESSPPLTFWNTLHPTEARLGFFARETKLGRQTDFSNSFYWFFVKKRRFRYTGWDQTKCVSAWGQSEECSLFLIFIGPNDLLPIGNQGRPRKYPPLFSFKHPSKCDIWPFSLTSKGVGHVTQQRRYRADEIDEWL